MITGFFLGVLASIVAAEVYLWLPTAARFLNERGEHAAGTQSPGGRLYRAARRASGTGAGVLLMAVFLVLETARRNRRLVKVLRLGLEIALMVLAVWASFSLRYDAEFRPSLLMPVLILVPLQMISLRMAGVREVFKARSLHDLRLIILGFLVSTLPLWMWAAIDRWSFTALGIPPSVLIINVDLVIALFVGTAMTNRLIELWRMRAESQAGVPG